MWRITWNSSEMPLPPCMSRATRAMSSALPQLLRLMSETISGAPALVHQAADAQRRLEAERDLGLHVGELQLDQLVRGERPAELLAVERVARAACQQNSAAPIAPQAMP
jgi:hypothetical protein